MYSRKTFKQRLDSASESKTLSPTMAFSNELIYCVPSENPLKMQFMGLGRMTKIVRGKDFDIVYASFDIGFRRVREIVVVNNHARRQLLTLKKGQFAIFVGQGQLTKRKAPKGYVKYWQLYSWANSGLYVPKTFDYKLHDKAVESGEETEQIEEMNENQAQELQDIVNQVLNQDFADMFVGNDKGGKE